MRVLPLPRNDDQSRCDQGDDQAEGQSEGRVEDRAGILAEERGYGTVPGVPLPPLARIVLNRARLRGALPMDVVLFVAACPACGSDREWTQTRDDTRVISTIDCDCTS